MADPGPIDLEGGGLLLVDKPVGWTSFDVVGKLRGALNSLAGRRVKVGHAGTLDPLASGLLVLAYGRRTKDLPGLTGLDKTYVGTLTLGEVTPSQDGETPAVAHGPWEHLDRRAVEAVLPRFTGALLQRPPLYSAKHHKGERAYFLARDGRTAEMEPVQVNVHHLAVLDMDGPRVTFTATVGKGTYIRTLAHDIGQALGCGAWLSALRRTRIAQLDVADALPPAELAQRIAPR
ncbi:MAG: tRNA pseudouridine(55) synthase TruB [Flavobacteriales bacterium]|nr:tRNA pseudouridine synthase B [Flavobacteriales bacterium]MCC6578217.1 tRNA pseudouridine(55) synthase TruB [Flavobacteriales bacterium]NUQ14340.1 tRNA pseudouridine(55) synthase TruB [Flavobacteriales bacterium]